MAQLIYDKNGRLMFTKEMKKEYTILFPMMLPVHFEMIRSILQEHGYNAVLLKTTGRHIVDEGLMYVHNDTCYPALLVIGQMLDAVKNGGYDPDKLALMITQTGGGCRASNYIHLLRKALKKSDLEKIPVISFNIAGLEKNPGFKLTLVMIAEIVYGICYSDLMTNLANQIRPYEIEKGSADKLIEEWTPKILKGSMHFAAYRRNIAAICADFAKIPIKKSAKVKVGIVGEIYMKYAPLGNNNLEEFLRGENCEVVVPGLIDFVILMCDTSVVDMNTFGINRRKGMLSLFLKYFLKHMQKIMIEAVRKYPQFAAPSDFESIKKMANGYVSETNKMGEGWLLTAEMIELIHSGTNNIVCTQPFGCLPNHIVGKGMIRAIRAAHPESNIVAIDYDPGATIINQENRIKLMLAVAKERLNETVKKPKDIQEQQPLRAAAGQ